MQTSSFDPRDDRVEVLRRVDLPTLLEELAAPRGLRARRRRFACPSVTHEQTGRTPPVTVRTVADGHELWHCHACGAGGSAVDALLAAGQARDVAEAFGQLRGERFEYLARVERPPASRRPSPEAEASPPDPAKARRALVGYIEHCQRRLLASEADRARRWLREDRGLTDAEIAAHKIGYDPGYHRLGRAYETLPAPPDAAVTLPLLDEAGTAVYVQARPLEVGEENSKFLNPFSSWIGASPRVSAILSPDTADRSVVVVSEGLCDGILAGRCFETWAIIGAGQPEDALAERLVKAAAGRPLAICFDSDKAGREGAKVLLDLIAEHGGHGVSVELPAKDVTVLMRETRERFEGTLRGLVEGAVEHMHGDQARARGDPLDRYRHLLGLRRTERLEARAAARADEIAHEDLAWLQSRSEELGVLFEGLDRPGAFATLRLECRRSAVSTSIEAYRNEIHGQDDAMAITTQGIIEQDQSQLARLEEEERELRASGRHLDDWLEPNFDAVVEWVAVERAISKELEVEQAIDCDTQRAVGETHSMEM